MRALQLVGQEQLCFVEYQLPDHVPAGHARVKVSHITLNHLDLFSYRGMAFAKRVLPLTVGAEGVGHVVALGADLSDELLGRAVAIYSSYFCGLCRNCTNQKENLCINGGGILGFHRHGLAAEYVDLPARMLVPVPADVPLEYAACVPITFATVHHMLYNNADLHQEDTILIHAGASGIGSTGIKMAKHVGATVFTTVGSDEKIPKVKALGADYVINYRNERFLRAVRERTNKRGVDVVLEHVGRDTWEESILSLALGGRLVTCGSTTGVEAKTNLLALFNQQLRIIGSFGAPLSSLQASFALIQAGVEPHIDSLLALDDFEVGVERLRRRDVVGKLVIRF